VSDTSEFRRGQHRATGAGGRHRQPSLWKVAFAAVRTELTRRAAVRAQVAVTESWWAARKEDYRNVLVAHGAWVPVTA
jgi:hypothetical protein